MKRKISLKTVFFVLLSMGAFVANGQKNYFEPVSAARMRIDASMTKNVKKVSFYRLNVKDLKEYLSKAPLEFKNLGAPLPLEIPLPNGVTETFEMVESPILSPEIAAKYPEIKTYTGQGKLNKGYTIRISFTSQGANAIILGVEADAVYFDKVSTDKNDPLYRSYFLRDAESPKKLKPFGPQNKCGALDPALTPKPTLPTGNKNTRQSSKLNNTGSVLRTFRLAMAANGDFTQQAVYGGDSLAAFAGLVGYVNRLNAIYRAELSIHFTLVTGAETVYADSAADPYTNSDQEASLNQNQATLDLVVGASNYDVGHVMGFVGSTGGGLAGQGVCVNGEKAKGYSGVGDGTFVSAFDDKLLAHEIGHQFSMSHSYNSSVPVCTSRESTTSVEPGSGITIMSYAYICFNNDFNAPDIQRDDYEGTGETIPPVLKFHSVSYEQAETYIATISCYTTTVLTNAVPLVTMPGNKTIPKSTPFSLAGTATDSDAGNVLTYSWEGTNIGAIVPDTTTLTNTAQPPFFRSYEPVSSGVRIFPRLSSILDGSNYAKGDKLPSVGIVTTHRLTVRDGLGGLTYGEMTVTIDGNSGPFLETTNLAGSYPGNSTKEITWSVNGTNAGAVNSPNVNILLSTDGGLTFPITLLSNTPNDGNQTVTLPAVLTSTARIKVESSNNIFFDISNTNFTITTPQVIVCTTKCPIVTIAIIK